MSVILMTTVLYKALILQGEIWCWSLLGLKGLSGGYFRARSADAQFPPSELWKVSWHFSFSWLVAAEVVTENYKRKEDELFQCFPW